LIKSSEVYINYKNFLKSKNLFLRTTQKKFIEEMSGSEKLGEMGYGKFWTGFKFID
jgi:hypothetical protein